MCYSKDGGLTFHFNVFLRLGFGLKDAGVHTSVSVPDLIKSGKTDSTVQGFWSSRDCKQLKTTEECRSKKLYCLIGAEQDTSIGHHGRLHQAVPTTPPFYSATLPPSLYLFILPHPLSL